MKKLALYIFCIFIGMQSVHPNEYFMRVYDNNLLHDGFLDVASISDYNYLAVGVSYDWYIGINYGLVVNANKSGNALNKSSHLGISNNNRFIAIDKKESKIFVGGGAYNPIEGAGDGLLARLDTNGQVLWAQNMNNGYNDRILDIIVQDTSLLLLGYEYLDTTLFLCKIYLVKTDTLGNVLLKRNFGFEGSLNFGYSIIETSDGGYLISGEHLTHTIINSMPAKNYSAMLIKLDSMFNQEWIRTYSNSNIELRKRIGQSNGVLEAEDGGYYMVGRTDTFRIPYQATNFNGRGFLKRLDAQGNVMWEKLFERGQFGETFNGIHKLNGNLIIHGSTWSYDVENGRPKAWLLNVDTAGNVLWERFFYHYSPLRDCHVHGKTITPSGDILISGYVFNPEGNGSHTTKNDGWLIKTDSCGYSERDTTLAFFLADQTTGYTIDLTNLSETDCSHIWDMGDGTVYPYQVSEHTYADTGMYTITLTTRAANTTDTYTLDVQINDTTTSVHELTERGGMKIYPNPAQDFIFIHFTSNENYDLRMYDLKGIKVYSKTDISKQTEIETKNIPAGIYIVELRNESHTHREKIVIVK